jgi:hypothetical protein
MAECKHFVEISDCGDCSPPAGRPPSPQLWGPWFTAARHGECDGCGDGIFPGDEIRADGDGGYLCRQCGYDGRGTRFSDWVAGQKAQDTPALAELRRRFQEGYT